MPQNNAIQPLRLPTVRLSADNIARLQRYPRPPHDNGRGLHFHLNLQPAAVAWTVEKLRYIDATWTMIYAQDQEQAQRAAVACWSAGIMPVVRAGRKVDEFLEVTEFVRALQAVNVPPYVQIYNEPGDDREWEDRRPGNYLEIFAGRWAQQAARVFDAGGYPGLQVMGREELDAAIDAVAANGRRDIWERAFFVQHNYGVNHPPAYPYDAVSQAEHPGLTILEDEVAMLAFLAFAHWMQQRIGFVLPIIGGEGGWQFGVDDDRRYPKVVQPYHADYHVATFDQFRTGVLANGEPLPDYLFSITPWLVSGWNTSEDWWGGPLGDKTETIEAVRAIPAFVRRFSWDGGTPDVGGGGVIDGSDGGEVPAEGGVGGGEVIDGNGDGEAPAAGGDNETSGGSTGSEPETGATPDLTWDPRLDALGVRLTRNPAAHAWRLVAAEYKDAAESGDKRHIYLHARDANGAPVAGVRFVVDWVGRRPDEDPGFTTTGADGAGNCPMFIGLDPAQKNGIIFATSADEAGDRVDGMGLPDFHNAAFVLTFRRD